MLNDDFSSSVLGKAPILSWKVIKYLKISLVHEMIGRGYYCQGIFILQAITLDISYNFLKFINLITRNFDSWYDIYFYFLSQKFFCHNWWKDEELYECLSNIIIRVFSPCLYFHLKCKKISGNFILVILNWIYHRIRTQKLEQSREI